MPNITTDHAITYTNTGQTGRFIVCSSIAVLCVSSSDDRPQRTAVKQTSRFTVWINGFILLHEKFLQIDWLRAVVFQLNLKYLHVKITNLLRVQV